MADPHPIPPDFSRAMLKLHGNAGQTWLKRLPALLDDCARRWSLTLQPPFQPLTYNYVAPTVRPDGTPLVLKVGVPNPELTTEIQALRRFDGQGAVRLLEADESLGALLLERLVPGQPLADLADDDQATRIAARVMQALWRPVLDEYPFPTVARWAEGLPRLRRTFSGGCGPFPAALVERAEGLFAELIPSMTGPVLLHGDLHHHNILSATRQPWLALDPKGLVGEPAYEVGALLRNPLPGLLEAPHPRRRLARRVDLLAEGLGFDRSRLIAWGTAQAVLSGWWIYEDHGQGWEGQLAVAELLTTI